MATKPDEPSETDRLKAVIRALNTALKQCHKLLAESEEAVRQSHQDNHPPSET